MNTFEAAFVDELEKIAKLPPSLKNAIRENIGSQIAVEKARIPINNMLTHPHQGIVKQVADFKKSQTGFSGLRRHVENYKSYRDPAFLEKGLRGGTDVHNYEFLQPMKEFKAGKISESELAGHTSGLDFVRGVKPPSWD